jgi:hypothetical protein
MRSYQTINSIMPQRLHFSRRDIEYIVRDELRAAQCWPAEPAPIRLEEYLLVRHGIEPQPLRPVTPGMLGLADLKNPAHPAIFVAPEVMDGPEHVYRSTVAHEVGHLMLHSQLYVDPEFTLALTRWRRGDAADGTITCLARDINETPRSGYNDGDPFAHIEHQANLGMVELLTPRLLLRKCIVNWTSSRPLRGGGTETVFDEARRGEAVTCISTTFNVSPTLASFRLQEIHPTN